MLGIELTTTGNRTPYDVAVWKLPKQIVGSEATATGWQCSDIFNNLKIYAGPVLFEDLSHAALE